MNRIAKVHWLAIVVALSMSLAGCADDVIVLKDDETPDEEMVSEGMDESQTETVTDAKAIEGDVIFDSFTVETSNPATTSQWRKNPVETTAFLTLPKGGNSDTMHPVVVYLLSSGGVGKTDKWWQKQFLKEGYAVLQIDQYTNRGLSLRTGLTKSQIGISDMSYLSDLYAGVRYLKEHPQIDPDRIALFGRSWGGGVQVFTMMDWYRNHWGKGLDIAARIALYPACYVTIDNPTPTAGKTLFLLGEKDDWNAPGQCIDFASRVQSAGGDVTVDVLEGAVHNFDGNYAVETLRGVTVWGRKCHMLWNPSTMKIWQSGDPERLDLPEGWNTAWNNCMVEDSVKIGGTRDQRSYAHDRVLSFLTANL